MPVVIATLGLISANVGQLQVGIQRLIVARTEQNFALGGEVMLQYSSKPRPTGAPPCNESKLVGAPVEG